MPPSRGLESGTGVVRLDKGRDVSWPELIRLEMLPVLKLFWLGLEVETEWSDLVGEEVTPGKHNYEQKPRTMKKQNWLD